MSAADAVLERSDRTTLLAFGVTVLLGAGNPIAIRLVSCETCELGPFQAAAIRFLLAGAILGIVAFSIGAPFPHGRGLKGSLLFGVLQFGVGFACIYYGYARTPAGVGQVLQACIPLLTFLFAIAHRQERFRWEGFVGSLLAIVGIAVVFGSGIDAGVPLASMVAILVGAAVWSESLVVARAFPQAHPTAMGAIAMATGTVILLALSVATGETWAMPMERSTWLAQAYLVVPGGVVVLWMILLVLRRWPASAASYQLVMITIVTVVLAAVLLDERLTWTFALGAMLVLVGVYIGALRGGAPLRSHVAGEGGIMSGSPRDSDRHELYTDLAPWFHLLTAPEDYELDARHALDVLTETIGEAPRTILELGSGGGNSASHMKAHATLTLTDLSEQMLELSRTINPEVEHVQGDMRTLRLEGRTFDGVFVHDAISYPLTEDDLRATLETAFVHLRPGGGAIFEPDITREAYADATHQGGHDGDDGRRLRYLQWRTDPDPDDSWYIDEFAILLHEADGTRRIAHDVHRLGMFPQATWFELLADVGFVDARMVPSPYDDAEAVGAVSFVGRRPPGN